VGAPIAPILVTDQTTHPTIMTDFDQVNRYFNEPKNVQLTENEIMNLILGLYDARETCVGRGHDATADNYAKIQKRLMTMINFQIPEAV